MLSKLPRLIENLDLAALNSSMDYGVAEVLGVSSTQVKAEVYYEYDDSAPHCVTVEIDGANILCSCSCPGEGAAGSAPRQCPHICALLDYMEWSGFPWPAAKMRLVEPDPQQAWRLAFQAIAKHQAPPLKLSPDRLFFVLDLEDTAANGKLTILTYTQRPKKRGGWAKPKWQAPSVIDALALSPTQRAAVQLLESFESEANYRWGYGRYEEGVSVPEAVNGSVLKTLGLSGGLHWRLNAEEPVDQWRPLRWSEEVWTVQATVADGGDVWELHGCFRCGDQQRLLTDPLLLCASGHVIFPDEAAEYRRSAGAYSWAVTLRARGRIVVPRDQSEALVEELAKSIGALDVLEVPEELQYTQELGVPAPRARIGRPERGTRMLPVEIDFLYHGEPALGGTAHVDHERRVIVGRDWEQEQQHLAAAEQASISFDGGPQLHADALPKVVSQLTREGWIVEADGKLLRRAGRMQISVTSGVDWFDLDGVFDFDGQHVSIPKVLSAMRRGEKYVTLDDGSQGLLPGQWLDKFGDIARLGEADGDSLRFSMPQAALLDALLDAQEGVAMDAKFRQYRERLRSFSGVEPAEAPSRFVGDLRDYQKEGLGWLHFLRQFGLGGCLADDMGLGKTIQVLALLQAERSRRLKKDEPRLPSLVVVPRSLIFNWLNEARRFTPKLKVMEYFGLRRKELLAQWDEQDLIITTYGIVRRDIEQLREKEFHYVVLDEAQAIKNNKSLSAKACRLLHGRHRLALTGTPVENHLGELWSLFEFLNPGLLGANEAFLSLARGAGKDSAARDMIARGIRPFVLRRTKDQVLTDLPAKTEQTVICEMGPEQRKQYDELRDYYRKLLSQKVAANGLARSKIHVLEALLRLRQCACHPRLLDPESSTDGAKVSALLEQVESLVDEGHKALIFSQFTKLLAVVRDELDRRKIAYEYLDGRTRKREDRVQAFQDNPDCPLFLISLKAGGHGLNLTAADYVFILDPWWNPAVEAQAVDRAHRIGQDKPVFAYRLICRDTVEEKILELQAEKRDLAEAIINADNSLLRDLTADDLAVLLS